MASDKSLTLKDVLCSYRYTIFCQVCLYGVTVLACAFLTDFGETFLCDCHLVWPEIGCH